MKLCKESKRYNKLFKYQDKNGEWRWRMVANNGRIIACSGEGYKTKNGLNKGISSLFTKEYKEVVMRNIQY